MSNVINVEFSRKGDILYTCDIYTYVMKKYRLSVMANNTTQAYISAIKEAEQYEEIGAIRCVVLFDVPSQNINDNTIPTKVHLNPKKDHVVL